MDSPTPLLAALNKGAVCSDTVFAMAAADLPGCVALAGRVDHFERTRRSDSVCRTLLISQLDKFAADFAVVQPSLRRKWARQLSISLQIYSRLLKERCLVANGLCQNINCYVEAANTLLSAIEAPPALPKKRSAMVDDYVRSFDFACHNDCTLLSSSKGDSGNFLSAS